MPSALISWSKFPLLCHKRIPGKQEENLHLFITLSYFFIIVTIFAYLHFNYLLHLAIIFISNREDNVNK